MTEREPIMHQVKCWPPFYRAVKDGRKPFELRYNDRDYRVGDILLLREWLPEKGIYTGSQCGREITYVYPAAEWMRDTLCYENPTKGALRDGWVILGLEERLP